MNPASQHARWSNPWTKNELVVEEGEDEEKYTLTFNTKPE
jgi:hypothetical protein